MNNNKNNSQFVFWVEMVSAFILGIFISWFIFVESGFGDWFASIVFDLFSK